jgi:hypothetical protein
MSFKNLNLKQQNLDVELRNYPNFVDFEKDFEKDVKKQLTQYSVNVDNEIALINVYFNKNGTTTINPNIGKDQVLSNKIASFLKDNLLISDIEQASFSIQKINENNFSLLKEYLIENKITIDKLDNLNGELFKLSSPFKDSMTITRYSNGNTLFQGKPLYIFSEIKIFLIDILDIKDVIDIENEVYKINLDVKEMQDELQSILKNSYPYLCATSKKMLTSALVFNKLGIELEDYTSFAFPALRAMEGYLKKTFLDSGISCSKNGFNQFDKNNNRFKLKAEYRSKVENIKIQNGLEKCYDFYNKHRHTLFHTNDIVETTRILENKNDASRLIKNVFKLIEETYSERISS